MLKTFTFLVLSVSVFASALRQPIMIEIADTIPRGVWAFFYSNTIGNYDQQYTANGSLEGLSSNFQRSISYNDILENIEDPQERAITQGAFENYGINDFESSAGQTDGALELTTTINVPIIAYGVTDKLSIGAAFPIVRVETAAASGFNASDSLQNLTNRIASEGAPSTAAEIQQETDNAITNELEKYNYNELERNETIMGDIQLWQRYQLIKDYDQMLTLGNRLNIPINNSSDVDDIIALDVNDGQWDIAPGLFHAYRLGGSWQMVNTLQYTFQLAGTTTKRIPRTRDNPLSSDRENVEFNPGDIAQFQHGHRFWLNKHLNFALAYDIQTKQRDQYSGAQFTQTSYDILADGSNQKLETLIAGLNFNTINLFLAKKFPVPMDLNITYARPLTGKNVIASELVTLQLGLFYK